LKITKSDDGSMSKDYSEKKLNSPQKITRKDFMKLAGAIGTALGLSPLLDFRMTLATPLPNANTSSTKIKPTTLTNLPTYFDYIVYKDQADNLYKAYNNRTGIVTAVDKLDAAVVIQNAVRNVPSAGGSIGFSDDVFIFNSPVILTNYLKLFAAHHRLTNQYDGPRFVRGDGLTSGFFMTQDNEQMSDQPFSSSYLYGLSFDGIDQNTVAYGVGGINANFDSCTIQECEFQHLGSAAIQIKSTKGSESCTIEGCKITNNYRGIYNQNSSSCVISNCIIGKSQLDNINIVGFSSRVVNNRLYEPSCSSLGYWNITISGSDYSLITNNMLEADNSNANMIQIDNSNVVTIANNRCKSATTGRFGFRFNNAKNCICMGNLISYLANNRDVTGIEETGDCYGNLFAFNRFNGSSFAKGNYSLITGNIIDESVYDVNSSSFPQRNPPLGSARIYLRAIDTDNDALFIRIRKNGIFSDVQIA
jgi:parallel beta-helix repeat protein